MIDHPYLDQLRQSLSVRRYSPDTIYNVTHQADRFLKMVGAKESYSAQDITGFVDRLLDQGIKPGSIPTILSAIRSLFLAIGHPWSLTKADLHLPREDNVAPMLSPLEVDRLTKRARLIGQPEVAVAALSTIFGLRAIELARVLAQGLAGDELVVVTAKGGRQRRHAIPEMLAPALTLRPITCSRVTLHRMFDRLMVGGVRPPRPGEGWHSVRRALVTGLLDAGVSGHVVESFMGWRTLGGRTIATYYRPDRRLVDETIFAVHPFLPFWAP